MLLTNKVKYFIYTGKCGGSQMVSSFRNNCDIFIDKLSVNIVKTRAGHEDEKTVMTVVCALNFTTLFVHIIFTVVNVWQNFSRLQVFFQMIVCSMLLSFYENMLLEDSHFFIKRSSSGKIIFCRPVSIDKIGSLCNHLYNPQTLDRYHSIHHK